MKTPQSIELLRVFCAVDLSAEARRRAADHIDGLRKLHPAAGAKWDRPEKLHVTLKFLGDVSRPRLDALAAATRRAANECGPFELAVEGTGVFPPRGAARVLWLGLKDPSGALARLQQRLEAECEAEKFVREERAYHPHLTLARLKTWAGADRQLVGAHKAARFEAVRFPVGEILIIRSVLEPSGSRYTVLERCGLGVK